MKNRYRLFKRGSVFYAHDSVTNKQESLQTRDKREAQRILMAKNEAQDTRLDRISFLGAVGLVIRGDFKPDRILQIEDHEHGCLRSLAVEDRDGSIFFLAAEGESVPGPILEIGNTNSRYRFSIGARGFVNDWNSHGPAHHCAVGIGHVVDRIEKLGKLL
jgi:hypothetical protein